MKTLSLTAALVFFFRIAFAQAPGIGWQQTVGFSGNVTTMARSLDVTADGGVFVAGTVMFFDSSINHYFAAKLNHDGSVKWLKTYGGNGGEECNALKATLDGGCILAGFSASNDGDVSGNHGSGDYWIVKLDSLGKIEWQHSYGGSKNDLAYSIDTTSDGGYIVGGYSYSEDGDVNGSGGMHMWIIRINQNGEIIWQKILGSSHNINCIKAIKDGKYIIAGDILISNPNTDGWLRKIDSVGNDIWNIGAGGAEIDGFNSVIPTNDRGYVLAGHAASNKGPFKLNHGGGDFWVVKYDSTGSLRWQKLYGGASGDVATSVTASEDGGYFIGGYTESNNGDVTNNHGQQDYWVIKIDGAGNLEWQKTYGGSRADETFAAQIDKFGNYILAGYSGSNDGDMTAPRYGLADAWIIKLSSGTVPVTLTNFTAQIKQPNVLLKWQTATEQNSKLFNIQRSTNGQQFTNIGTVAAAGNSNTLRTYNYTDYDALTLSTQTLYYRIEEMDNDGKKMYSKIVTVSNTSQRLAFTLAGNPVHNTINVQANIQAQAAVKLTDVNGKVMYTGTKTFYPNSNVGIPAVGLAKGIYLLTIQSKGIKATMKVMVE